MKKIYVKIMQENFSTDASPGRHTGEFCQNLSKSTVNKGESAVNKGRSAVKKAEESAVTKKIRHLPCAPPSLTTFERSDALRESCWQGRAAAWMAGQQTRRRSRTRRRSSRIFWQIFDKFRSFSAVLAPIFARKYAFCSIFQNLPDSQAEIFEI